MSKSRRNSHEDKTNSGLEGSSCYSPLIACELSRAPILASTIFCLSRSELSSRKTGRSIKRANASSSFFVNCARVRCLSPASLDSSCRTSAASLARSLPLRGLRFFNSPSRNSPRPAAESRETAKVARPSEIASKSAIEVRSSVSASRCKSRATISFWFIIFPAHQPNAFSNRLLTASRPSTTLRWLPELYPWRTTGTPYCGASAKRVSFRLMYSSKTVILGISFFT